MAINRNKKAFINKLILFSVAGPVLVSLGACTTPGKNTAKGAGIGALAGAGVGALVGANSGNAGKAALIGAGLGALAGGAIGNRLDKQAKELEKVAETKRTEEGIITRLKSDILFDTGKAELKPAAKVNIAQLGAIIKKYPENRLTVVGYTDNRGSYQLNQKLSEERARAVMQELALAGVPGEAMAVVGRADANPVASNASAEGQAKNRRVEIEIKAKPESKSAS